jgi:hypothetical protein
MQRWYALDPALADEPFVASLTARDRGAAQRIAEQLEADHRFEGETLHGAGRTFAAGRFSTPTLGELRNQPARNGRIKLTRVEGVHVLTDIGTLQATAPPGTLFQVASQFNCLESPDPVVVPIAEYVHDSTQGPRACISALPGIMLRHYGGYQPINLLDNVTDAVENGYLLSNNIENARVLEKSLIDHFDDIRVGVHDGIEVVFGHNWDGPVPPGAARIAQVCTSTIALGGYSRDTGDLDIVRRQLLRAAYLGTLLAATSLDKRTVVLTMIGGGAFGNPRRDIWDAIRWAIAEAERYVDGTMDVIVNTFERTYDGNVVASPA